MTVKYSASVAAAEGRCLGESRAALTKVPASMARSLPIVQGQDPGHRLADVAIVWVQVKLGDPVATKSAMSCAGLGAPRPRRAGQPLRA